MTLLRTAIRAFVIGFVVGVLFAPRSGAETRRMLREKFEALVNQVFELADLPPIQAGAADGSPVPSAAATAAAPPRRTRNRRAEESGAGPSA
ncbi:MAG: YtxH domain-containing protein [Candidatus Limnocylindria bacterium]